jgi:hypothetical protein
MRLAPYSYWQQDSGDTELALSGLPTPARRAAEVSAGGYAARVETPQLPETPADPTSAVPMPRPPSQAGPGGAPAPHPHGAGPALPAPLARSAPPGPAGPPGVPMQRPPGHPGRRRIPIKRLLLILLVAGAVLVITGTGVGFYLYNKATEPNRSTPTVAVDQFLNALFVEKSDESVRLFTCPQWTSDQTAQVRSRFDPEVKVSWGVVTEQSRQHDQGTVTARLRLNFQGHSDLQEWRFDVVNRKGWRVCGAAPASF